MLYSRPTRNAGIVVLPAETVVVFDDDDDDELLPPQPAINRAAPASPTAASVRSLDVKYGIILSSESHSLATEARPPLVMLYLSVTAIMRY